MEVGVNVKMSKIHEDINKNYPWGYWRHYISIGRACHESFQESFHFKIYFHCNTNVKTPVLICRGLLFLLSLKYETDMHNRYRN